jgi:hypothetical protein
VVGDVRDHVKRRPPTSYPVRVIMTKGRTPKSLRKLCGTLRCSHRRTASTRAVPSEQATTASLCQAKRPHGEHLATASAPCPAVPYLPTALTRSETVNSVVFRR